MHHQPPKGRGKILVIGDHFLRPALFGLCGSGTTGCHGRIHAGKIKVTWEWIKDEFSEAWWSGELLEKYGAHSEELFRYGYWNFQQNIPSGVHHEDYHIFL